jgi:hypothetical protein
LETTALKPLTAKYAEEFAEIAEKATPGLLSVLWVFSAVSAVKSFIPDSLIGPNLRARPDNIEVRLTPK